MARKLWSGRTKKARKIAEDITHRVIPPIFIGKPTTEVLQMLKFSITNTKPMFRKKAWGANWRLVLSTIETALGETD